MHRICAHKLRMPGSSNPLLLPDPHFSLLWFTCGWCLFGITSKEILQPPQCEQQTQSAAVLCALVWVLGAGLASSVAKQPPSLCAVHVTCSWIHLMTRSRHRLSAVSSGWFLLCTSTISEIARGAAFIPEMIRLLRKSKMFPCELKNRT